MKIFMSGSTAWYIVYEPHMFNNLVILLLTCCYKITSYIDPRVKFPTTIYMRSCTIIDIIDLIDTRMTMVYLNNVMLK